MIFTADANAFALLVMIAWIPAILLMFCVMKPRHAIIAAFVIGYLFLPELGVRFPTTPEANKASLTSLGVLLGCLMFDPVRLTSLKPKLLDLCWVAMPICSIATSVTNGLGIMDGLYNFFDLLLRWGFAYWIGRAYLTDWAAVRELAIGIVLGGMAYVPLCWWEIRMSPQLHGQIYGSLSTSFRSDNYLFGIRLFGFRPNVFLTHGLAVTMFMGITAVIAFWLWMTGSVKKLLGVPMGWIAFGLIVTTFFCKAMGGTALMGVGLLVLTFVRWPRTKVFALVLMLAAPGYIFLRTCTAWSGEDLVEAASKFSQTRGSSLEFRLQNEDILVQKAMSRPMFGWGGWRRSHVFDVSGHDISITDGLWILLLGQYGFAGLGAFVLAGTGSAVLLWWRVPRRFWTDPACAAPVALAIIIAMYMFDSLFNATFNPITSLAVGGSVSIAALARTTFSRRNLRQAQAPAVPAAATLPARPVAVVGSARDLGYVYSPYRV